MPENNLFAIKKRAKAAGQTRKITRTMELIASSRLQRGKTLLTGAEDWLENLREAAKCLPVSYFRPLFEETQGGRTAYIIFGGSRGLSGAYSPNLMQYAKPIAEGQIIIAVGSATEKFFPEARIILGDDIPSVNFAQTIVQTAKDLYESGEADAVVMVYTRGHTNLHVTESLFPFVGQEEEHESTAIIEPSAAELFPALFEEYARAIVYEAHLQAFVAEQVARVAAMDSATQNADEIIENLQATYNRMRQSAITREIIDMGNAARGENG